MSLRNLNNGELGQLLLLIKKINGEKVAGKNSDIPELGIVKPENKSFENSSKDFTFSQTPSDFAFSSDDVDLDGAERSAREFAKQRHIGGRFGTSTETMSDNEREIADAVRKNRENQLKRFRGTAEK